MIGTPTEYTIRKSEWLLVFIVSTFILIITSLPYVFAYKTVPSDKVYMGIMMDVPDHLQYFSWMRELTHANLASNKLTPEPNNPVFFNLLWWSLGRIGNAFGLDYPGVYQFLRVTATVLFLFAVYHLCALYFEDIKKRVFSFLIICFTSGLGWIWVVLKYTLTKGELLFPLDVYIAEGNTFLCILAFPHFIAALLYVFVFNLVITGEKKNSYVHSILAGLVALLLGWQHTYDLITVYAVLGIYGVLKWYRSRDLPRYLLKSGIIIFLISCWPAIYSVLLTSLDPLWKQVLEQFDNAGVFTPNLFHLPILLGLPFLISVFVGAVENPFRKRAFSDRDIFIVGWFWVGFVLVYLPVDYQIHLINGWQIPISFLATKGIFDYILPFLRRWGNAKGIKIKEKILLISVLSFFTLTNIYLYAWRFVELSRYDYPYFLNKEEVAGLRWLEKNAQPDDVVFSSLTIGQYIPAYTGAYAYLAHWAQTVDYYSKLNSVNDFFNAEVSEQRKAQILQEKGVDYVFFGPAEKLLGEYVPSNAYFLDEVFTDGEVIIFKFNENKLKDFR